jgi:hypothetical protein
MNNTTGATCGVGTAYLSGVPEFTSGFSEVRLAQKILSGADHKTGISLLSKSRNIYQRFTTFHSTFVSFKVLIDMYLLQNSIHIFSVSFTFPEYLSSPLVLVRFVLLNL